ncbi:MAG: YqaA family protein [Pseudomonadota bacterium]
MLRRLYDWVIDLAAHPKAPWVLSGVSFAESSIFPIPPDAMLIPMILAERAKAWFFAAVCTISSVLGGMAGYAIGYFLFELVGKPILGFYGYEQAFADFAGRYNEYGAWIVFFAGVTPFPYKVITIASGATALNFWVFMIASVVARGLRFFVVAALLYWFGPPIRAFIERRLGLVTTLFIVSLFAGFIAIKYLK